MLDSLSQLPVGAFDRATAAAARSLPRQGVEVTLGSLEFDACPPQAYLLEEKQLIVAGIGRDTVSQLYVPWVVFVENGLACLGGF